MPTFPPVACRSRRRTVLRLVLLVAFVASAGFTAANVPAAEATAEAAAFDGHWEGAIALPAGSLELDIDLASDAEGAISGDISIPIQNIRDMPLGGFERDERSLSFRIPGIPGDPTFDGELSADGATFSGDFHQGGAALTFHLERADAPADRSRAVLDDLEAQIEQALVDYNVPGLGLAVVHDGQVVYAQGFGSRDLENELPMTADSLFSIGSTTKAMTATLLGMQVDDGLLEWDEPVIDVMPEFRLADAALSARITPRDLVTHRTGMPRHDLLWYNEKDLDRDEIVDRLEHLELSADLREEWQYNNLMFLAAGVLAGQIDDRSWEETLEARLFAPLGMERSTPSTKEAQRDPDHALPYRQTDEDELERISFRDIDLVGPAGSVSSSVREMARWLLLNLRGGSIDGEQLVRTTTIADLHSPQMTMPSAPGGSGRVVQQAYGLGWVTDVYRGHRRVHHGGGIDGFITTVRLFPDDGLGIVAFTNVGSPLSRVVASTIADRLLELEPIDWFGEELAEVRAARDAATQAEADAGDAKVPGTAPSHPLADYAGRYEHPAYGTLEIGLDGDALSFTYNDITTSLEHWHYNVWKGLENEVDKTFNDMELLFRSGFDGEISEVLAPFEILVSPIVFTKQPPAELFDPAFLERYAGAYQGPADQVARISVASQGLSLQLGGQGVFELEPLVSGRFAIGKLQGFTAGFENGESGAVSTLVFFQPNGVFRFERLEEPEE